MADITGTFSAGQASGRFLIKTGRAGLPARAGHGLTIEITRWSARIMAPAEDSAGEGGGRIAAAVTAELDLGSLAVREGTGDAKPLTDRDRRDIGSTVRKILGGQATAGRVRSGHRPRRCTGSGFLTAGVPRSSSDCGDQDVYPG